MAYDKLVRAWPDERSTYYTNCEHPSVDNKYWKEVVDHIDKLVRNAS